MTVASLLAKKGRGVVSVKPRDTVRAALAALAEHHIGAVVVVDDQGRVVGILSERDVVRALVRDERVLAAEVRELMTGDVVLGVPHDDLRAVLHTMTERRFRHLPVVESGQLVGIISMGDVVKAQRDEYSGEVDNFHIQFLHEEV